MMITGFAEPKGNRHRPLASPIVAAVLILILLFCSSQLHGQTAQRPEAQTTASGTKAAEGVATHSQVEIYTFASVVEYALKNNPRVRMSAKDVETEAYGIDAARAERMPRIDFGSSATRYRYPTPLTPLIISKPSDFGVDIPDFERNIYDASGSFRLPLFKGGRLYRGVRVAEMRKALAEDNYMTTKQDLVYNLSGVFFKIAELEQLLRAHEASAQALEAHKRDVTTMLEAGSAAQIDLLKTDVELSHAIERRIVVKNNLESAYELLKTLMGVDNMDKKIAINPQTTSLYPCPPIHESLDRALTLRPEYKAVLKKKIILEERIKIAQGKRLPDIYAGGEYSSRAGDSLGFKENWYAGVRLSVPVFDGGLISAEVSKERTELQKALEEERSLKLAISKEVRDAYIAIANADERISVTEKAIESARETMRVERLKYETGAGTTTDVIDAQSALLRAETDYYQALFDRELALASLKRAIGEDAYQPITGG